MTFRVRVRIGRTLLTAALAAVVFCSAVRVTHAQAVTAAIVGRVTDESGAVLPGVTVTASSPALQLGQQVAVTDAQGEYRLTPLPIGVYNVSFALSGFQTVNREALRLSVGFVAQVNVAMKVGALEESITVSGASPVVDVTSTGSATQLTRETIELTPTSRNGVISLLAQVPGVRANLDVGGGTLGDPPTYRTYGMEAESWTTMEGVVTTDARHGGNYFNFAAIDEARVQTIANEAEVPSRGVAITMVTKSGGDSFHGGGLVAYQGKRLQSSNIDAQLASQGITSGNPLRAQTDQGGDLGGRIVRGRVWFYGGARYRTQNRQVLGSFKPDGTPANQAQYETLLNGKMSSQLSRNNRLIGFAQWAQKYHYSGGSQFALWETRVDRKPPVRANVAKVEWQSMRGSNFMTSLQLGFWKWTAGIGIANMDPVSILTDADHGGGQPARFDQATLALTGTNASAGRFDEYSRFHAKGSFTWYRSNLGVGNHEFKGGFDYIPNQNSLSFYSRGTAGEYQLTFNNGAPFQIDVYNNPATPLTRAHHTGLWLKDNWVLGRRLTLNLGLRYARDNGFIPSQCRDEGQFAPAGCIDKIQSAIWNSVAPRLYASYDLGGTGKTVIKGGWGRFNHVRTEDEILPMNPFVSTSSAYRWRDLNGNRNYDAGEVNLDPNGPDFLRTVVRDTGSLTSNGAVNPDERQPGVDQYSVTLEHELAPNFGVRVSLLSARTFNEARRLNVLRPYEAYNVPVTNADPGPDGRLNTADDPGRTVTYYEFAPELAGREFQQTILVADPRSNETHNTIEVATQRRFSNRWQFGASYSATKNRALAPKTRGTTYHAAANLDPNTEYNTGDNTWEWLARISGVYVLPWSVNVSANFDHRSGLPQSRQVLFTGGRTIPSLVLNVDPLGTIRLPSTNIVDLRFDKTIPLSRGQRVIARVNFYNLMNANTTTAWTLRSGPAFLRPTAILAPRIVEFGASYTF
ncbi:MAG: carboxypeptidase regulatory-like domain-containing protein [Vicinamibacterales bacterium]